MEELNCTTAVDHYRKRLRVFGEKTAQGKMLYGTLSRTIPLELEKFNSDVSQREQINILSIGSGEGEADIEILKIINDYVLRKKENKAKHRIQIYNKVIEPDKNALDLYKAKVENLPQELSNATISFDTSLPRTVDEYIAEYTDGCVIPFDIIHLLHCVYYISDLKRALEHFFEKELRSKGTIILVFAHTNDLMCTLQNKGYSQCPIPYDRTGEILEIAEKNSWRFTMYIKEHLYDISEIFEENSEEGSLLLDFFVFQKNFRSQGKREEIDKVLKIIQENSVYKEGKYLAKKAQRIIFIHKH